MCINSGRLCCGARTCPGCFPAWRAAPRLPTCSVGRSRSVSRRRRDGGSPQISPILTISPYDLQRRYGYFLHYLSRRGLLSHDKPTAGHVTPENVHAFLVELKQRVSSVTLYGSIYKLRRASELMAPGEAFGWL